MGKPLCTSKGFSLVSIIVTWIFRQTIPEENLLNEFNLFPVVWTKSKSIVKLFIFLSLPLSFSSTVPPSFQPFFPFLFLLPFFPSFFTLNVQNDVGALRGKTVGLKGEPWLHFKRYVYSSLEHFAPTPLVFLSKRRIDDSEMWFENMPLHLQASGRTGTQSWSYIL